MSSTPEMSQEESSYQAVRKPSRYIRKTLLDVLFTASAESKKHHQLPDEWVTKPPADFIPNIQATLADVHLQFKEKKKKAVLLRSAQFVDLWVKYYCFEPLSFGLVWYAVIDNLKWW